jgi:site-specific recombinase XerD
LLQGQFREYLQGRNFSIRTVEEYPKLIEPFLLYLQEEKIEDIKQVTCKHVRIYQRYLMSRNWQGRPLSPATVRLRLGHIKSFFCFLHKTNRIYHDPLSNLELPRRGIRLPRGILEVKEVLSMLESVDITTAIGLRDRAILELLYSSGLRSRELRYIELQDLDMDGNTLRIEGKGAVEALVPFGQSAKRALENYLLFGRHKLLNGFEGGKQKTQKRLREEKGKHYVFLSKNGHLLGDANMYMMIRSYAKSCGIERKIGAHSFRHTCATHLLKNGADIRHIQKLLRHKDINTTQIYTRVSIEDLKQAQIKYHPREKMG